MHSGMQGFEIMESERGWYKRKTDARVCHVPAIMMNSGVGWAETITYYMAGDREGNGVQNVVSSF